MAVCSHDNSTVGAATFDPVNIDKPGTEDQVPHIPGSGDGLAGTYFDGITGKSVNRIDPNVNFDWNDSDSPAPGVGHDNFSARWEGFLQAESDEPYALHVVSDDGARLWLDGQLVVDAWTDQGASQHSVYLKLTKDTLHRVTLEYYQRTREAIAQLLWSTPTLPKQPIPPSQLYSTLPIDLAARGLVLAGDAPSTSQDTNGASNSPTDANTDAGAQTGAKASVKATATLTGFSTVVEVHGADAVSRLGLWEKESTSLCAKDRRGSLEYELTAPAAGMYRFEVEDASNNPFDVDFGFYLRISADGEYLEKSLLTAALNESGRVQVFTPWLSAGSHRFRIDWDNARKGRSLKLIAVRLQALRGADADQNGVVDWVENKLETENAVDSIPMPGLSSVVGSLISPICLEGRGGFLSLMKIDIGGQPIAAQHAAGNRWFANIALSEAQSTPVTVSFQNGARRQYTRLVWQPTDLLKAGNLTVRQGDSLLLFAGDGSGASVSSVGTSEHLRIEVAGIAFYDGAPKPVPCRFDQPGTVPVTVIFRDAQAVSHKRTVSVKVVGSSFSGSPAAWTGRERVWDCPNLAAEAVLDHDAKTQLTADSTANQTGRRFRLKVTEGEDRWVVARLGQGGPILASALIRGIDILGVSESGAFYGEKYADGSCLVETAVAQSRVFPDVTVPVEIVVGGVMFEDGTLLKTLQARDFDETGLAILHFIMPPGTQTSNCHVMKAFHTQVYLGEY